MLITEIQYFPPVIWYINSTTFRNIKIEQYEHWQKMSFRNRCSILGSNGRIDLTVPIKGGRNSREMIRDVRIDNLQKWQDRHWKNITSAYNRSPWFEYYKGELEAIFSRQFHFLWDWNLELLHWSFAKIKLDVEIELTESYEKVYAGSNQIDLRNSILPANIAGFANQCPKYNQVFENRFGFIPNLSIIDLLFCEGNNAAALLKEGQSSLL